MKSLRIFQLLLILTATAILILSAWKLFVGADYFPYLFLLFTSFLSVTLFLAVFLTKDTKRSGIIRTGISAFTVGLIGACYFFPALIKEFYPLILWSVIAVLLSSVQEILDHYKKRQHLKLRLMNYGLIILLLAPIMLKVSETWIWSFVSFLTTAVLLINLVFFLLPVKTIHHSK